MGWLLEWLSVQLRNDLAYAFPPPEWLREETVLALAHFRAPDFSQYFSWDVVKAFDLNHASLAEKEAWREEFARKIERQAGGDVRLEQAPPGAFPCPPTRRTPCMDASLTGMAARRW